MSKVVKLGTIELGVKVMISDPTYRIGTWCTHTVENMKPGTYTCYAVVADEKSYGLHSEGRIAEQYVLFGETTIEDFNEDYIPLCDIGVDSATAGVFDFEFFESIQEEQKRERWYGLIEGLVHEEIEYWTAGTMENKGVITSTGYGDGGYDVFALVKEGQVVGLNIVFMCPEC